MLVLPHPNFDPLFSHHLLHIWIRLPDAPTRAANCPFWIYLLSATEIQRVQLAYRQVKSCEDGYVTSWIFEPYVFQINLHATITVL
jgi:hypothetical protein